MANSIPDPIILPDINLALPAEPIRAEEVAKLLGCLNVANAYVGSGMVIQQSWDAWEDALGYDLSDVPAFSYRIKAPTAYHTALRVRVRGEVVDNGGIEGGGRVRVASEFGADEVEEDLPVAPSSAWIELGDLAIDNGPDGYEIIHVYVERVGGNWNAELRQIACEILPLSDPLPAASIGGAVPFGLDTIVADRPLPAPLGHKIIDTIQALLDRPIHLMVWTGSNSLIDEALYDDDWGWWSVLGHARYAPLYPRSIEAVASVDEWWRWDPGEDLEELDGATASVRVGSLILALAEDTTSRGEGDLAPDGTIDTGHTDPLVRVAPIVILGDDADGRLLPDRVLANISIWSR